MNRKYTLLINMNSQQLEKIKQKISCQKTTFNKKSLEKPINQNKISQNTISNTHELRPFNRYKFINSQNLSQHSVHLLQTTKNKQSVIHKNLKQNKQLEQQKSIKTQINFKNSLKKTHYRHLQQYFQKMVMKKSISLKNIEIPQLNSRDFSKMNRIKVRNLKKKHYENTGKQKLNFQKQYDEKYLQSFETEKNILSKQIVLKKNLKALNLQTQNDPLVSEKIIMQQFHSDKNNNVKRINKIAHFRRKKTEYTDHCDLNNWKSQVQVQSKGKNLDNFCINQYLIDRSIVIKQKVQPL